MARGQRITVEFAGDTSSLDKAFAKVQQGSSGVEKAVKTVAGAAAFGLVTDQIHDAINAASNLNESLSKSNNVFGQSGAAIDAWAKSGAENFGLSRQAALEAASSFGNMFSQLGVGAGQAASMSQSIVQLAADFASFHNADISQVIAAQQSAFRGEYDALQRFLPTISAAAVEQEALKETGKKTTAALTDQEKALAVNTLMFQGAGAAQGDFARTSGGAANSQRILAAEMDNLQATLGSELLPVFTDLVHFITNDAIPAIEQLLQIASEPPDAAGFWGQYANTLKDWGKDVLGWAAELPGPILKLGGIFSGSFRDASDATDDFATKMHRSSQEAFLGAHAQDAVSAATASAKNLTKGATDATDKHATSSQKSAKAMAEEAKATTALGDAKLAARQSDLALDESTHALGIAQDAYNKFLETGGIDADKVKAAQDALTQTQKDVERATLDVADAQDAVNKALEKASPQEQAKAGRDVAGAADDVTTAQLDLTDAQNAYYKINLSTTATEEEKTRAWLRANEASRTLADAQDRLTAAQQAQTDTSNKGSTSSQAYKDAVSILTDKQGLLKEAVGKNQVAQNALNTEQGLGKDHAQKLWEVTDNLKNAQLDLDTKTWGAKKAHDALKTSLDATKESARGAWGNVAGLNTELGKVPKDVTTKIHVQTYEEMYTPPATATATNQSEYAKYLTAITKQFPNADPMPYDVWNQRYGGKKAAGGAVKPGMAYTVGENGPETWIPGQSGMIVPNGGTGTTVINNYFNAPIDRAGVAREMAELLREERRLSGPLGLN